MSETRGTCGGTTQDNEEDAQRHSMGTALEERTYASEVRPAGITRTVSTGERRDPVRWGPIWAGLVVLLSTRTTSTCRRRKRRFATAIGATARRSPIAGIRVSVVDESPLRHVLITAVAILRALPCRR